MDKLAALRRAVAVWAFAGLIGIPAMVYFDPFGGWQWQPENPIYDQMIVSIYFALGVCALRAIRHPLEHVSFLWFVVISSTTHGGVMLYHAVVHPMHIGHLLGDVWILAGALSLALPLLSLRARSDVRD
ncbi:MAG: DUF6632 domain-containing protein [Novosphingobium sp.]